MFDDLDILDTDVETVRNSNQGSETPRQGAITQQVTQQQSSQGNQGNFSKNNWQRKPDEIQEPYIPVSIFIEREFPEEIKEKLYSLASRLISKGITVRYNATELDTHNRMQSFSREKTEGYVPWKGFNEIVTKFYYNTLTANHIAQTNFSAWDKIPRPVQAIFASNVRMLFGDKNNSPTMCLITWSKDGASRKSEVTRDTGKSSFIISVASRYHYPVINIGKEGALEIIERNFDL